MKKNNDSAARQRNENIGMMEEKNVFCCSAIDSNGSACMCRFMTRSSLENHLLGGKHKFEKINSLTKGILEITKPGAEYEMRQPNQCLHTCGAPGVFEWRTSADRDERDDDEDRSNTSISHNMEGTGFYNVVYRGDFYYSCELRRDLYRMWKRGEQSSDGANTNSSKYGYMEAYNELSKMVVGGRRKYNHDETNFNGPLPDDPTKVKQFFKVLKRNKGKYPLKPGDDYHNEPEPV